MFERGWGGALPIIVRPARFDPMLVQLLGYLFINLGQRTFLGGGGGDGSLKLPQIIVFEWYVVILTAN